MKRRDYIITLIFIVLCCSNIIKVRANPVVSSYPLENPVIRSIFIIFIFIIGTFVEYIVYRLRFRITKYEKYPLMKSCYKVNLITFPITQIIAYIIYVYLEFYFWIYILIIEIFVIGIEWRLFKMEFENRIKSFEFDGNRERFLSEKILICSMISNTFSFFVGLIAFAPPLIM